MSSALTLTEGLTFFIFTRKWFERWRFLSILFSYLQFPSKRKLKVYLKVYFQYSRIEDVTLPFLLLWKFSCLQKPMRGKIERVELVSPWLQSWLKPRAFGYSIMRFPELISSNIWVIYKPNSSWFPNHWIPNHFCGLENLEDVLILSDWEGFWEETLRLVSIKPLL